MTQVSDFWQKNIRTIQQIIQQNQGPQVVNVVSGNQPDQAYWQDRMYKTASDVFRVDGKTMIISTLEKTRKGNFLGSLNAWIEVRKALGANPLPAVMLMNMVFGQGKRLSPFTQALTNRKPAFPTPMRSSDQTIYLTTADAAAMSATLWQHHLESNGFRGIIVKWGDEAVIPGKIWTDTSYEEVDGIRFIWQTDPTEDLAREKEWVEFDEHDLHMTYQYTRQGLESLHQRISRRGQNRCVGVNLGSLGISYRLMELAEEVFKEEIRDPNQWLDWDPYTWIALACKDETEWQAEADYEKQIGKNGIQDLEKRWPGFFIKIQQLQLRFKTRYGRLPVIQVLDFGQPYWMDWGLHLSLRHSLEALPTDSKDGVTLRELFHLPHGRDQAGNIILRSSIPDGADIRDSIIIDSILTDRATVIHGGVVLAGRHRKLEMPLGGSALFCAADEMGFTGEHAIAFKLSGDRIELAEGDRLTCLYLSGETIEMRTNETLLSYDGENYSMPVMGNPISFDEAARRMSSEDTRLVEERWLERWAGWLK